MSVSLLLFVLSGSGIILLIALKMLQERLGLLLFWPDIRATIEVSLVKRADKVREFSRTFNRRTFYIILHYILIKLRALFVILQQKIDARLVRLMDLIKGKRTTTSVKGTASHFLHDIHRFKDKFRRQKDFD